MLRRAFLAEFFGTALLMATVVGSGIMAERLAGGNAAIALMANTLATGAALIALIAAFSSHSGAHFNPVVTLVERALGNISWMIVGVHLVAQVTGAVAGTIAAHQMFGLSLISLSQHVRSGPAQWWSEVVATFGLIIVILNVAKTRPTFLPVAVGSYITAAYWFTASTSFANPAATIARSLTNTFTGIRFSDVPGFIVSEFVGGFLALWLFRAMEIPKAEDNRLI